MAGRVAPLDLLRSLGLLPDGPVLFGQTLPSPRPGVYLVEWPGVEARAPLDHGQLRAWLERVETLRLDGQRPTPHELAARLARYWLPEQTIVYVGQTTRSLRRRVAEFAATPLGERRPHAGGYWLKTLRDLDRTRVWWAETDAPEEYEDALLEAFGEAIGEPGTLPFGNLTSLGSGRREHGLSGTLLVDVDALPGAAVAAAGTGAAALPGSAAAFTGMGPASRRTTRPGASGAAKSSGTPRTRTPRASASAGPATPRLEPVLLTRDGLSRLRAELTHLREVRRPEVIARVKAARELGDLRENAEYHAAREEQSFLEGRIQQLQATLDRVVVTEAEVASGVVQVGSTVEVEMDDERATYQLVDPAEASIAAGRLSYRSPIGAALLGRRAGEDVTVATPAGAHTYRIVAVS
jgi:transcription elongation factor GreA